MMPSSGDDRRPKKPRSPSSSTPTTRDWTSLPQEILFTIFLKLGSGDILLGADCVCAAWRRVAAGEPTLWRRLDMGTVAMSQCFTAIAVRRAAGQCESFAGRFCSDASLLVLATGAPSLKILRLLDTDVSVEALLESIKKLSQLEELEVQLPHLDPVEYNKLVRSICEARPQLKKLSVTVLLVSSTPIGDREELVIPVMSELRFLELTDQGVFTVEELESIIDKCPLLKSLHIRHLYRFHLQPLRERCKAKNLSLGITRSPISSYPQNVSSWGWK